MKLLIIPSLLLVLSAVESKKGVKQKIVTVKSLDGADFMAGARIGFECKRVQVPLFRSHKKMPTVVFESITIIKYTRIVITGEIAFDLVCRRDIKTDKGDVVPPEEAEDAAEEANEQTSKENEDEEKGEKGGGFSNAKAEGAKIDKASKRSKKGKGKKVK